MEVLGYTSCITNLVFTKGFDEMKEHNPHIDAHSIYDRKRKARSKRWLLISVLLMVLVIIAAVLRMNLGAIQQAPGPDWMHDGLDTFYKAHDDSRFMS